MKITAPAETGDESPVTSFVQLERYNAIRLVQIVHASLSSLSKVIRGTALLDAEVQALAGSLLKQEVGDTRLINFTRALLKWLHFSFLLSSQGSPAVEQPFGRPRRSYSLVTSLSRQDTCFGFLGGEVQLEFFVKWCLGPFRVVPSWHFSECATTANCKVTIATYLRLLTWGSLYEFWWLQLKQSQGHFLSQWVDVWTLPK